MNSLNRKLMVFAEIKDDVLHLDQGPGGNWLANKQRNAEKDMAIPQYKGSHIGKGLSGSTTGYFRKVKLPPSYLKKFKGASDENPKPGQVKYNELHNSIRKHGWDEDKAGSVMLHVNHKGEPYIYEGNNRIAHAAGLKIPHLNVEVQYKNGGEMADGPAHPDKILALHHKIEGT